MVTLFITDESRNWEKVSQGDQPRRSAKNKSVNLREIKSLLYYYAFNIDMQRFPLPTVRI